MFGRKSRGHSESRVPEDKFTDRRASTEVKPDRPGARARGACNRTKTPEVFEDIAARYGQEVHRSAVGEAHVVALMRDVEAVLGGEGNGGVILPDLHYGRDGLVDTAMILQFMAETGKSLTELIADYPVYHIAKHRLEIDGKNARSALARLAEKYVDNPDVRISTVDGVKLDLDEGWAHLRTSNTEPILRIYAEAKSDEAANNLAERFKAELLELA